VFVPGRPFKLSLMFVSKEHLSVALHLGRLLSFPTNKAREVCQEQTAQLITKFVNYGRNKFYNIGPRCHHWRPSYLSFTFLGNFFKADKDISATKHGRRTLIKIVQQYTFSTLEKCFLQRTIFLFW
jgi:hypothetical protein